ncbi:hypothetical protein AMAG_16685 [Allomyces macrogynus ATCC 38327]|uniref:Uncharacterized protein n=1 Tax=Allomyces macrogynus (strain ATCC 38327) TaxID=578462 RepID=A0A0L0TBV6_ALLM3|nr:hypothetical protein AMAG_16685 [Allomyces macrogynus ATCC 38327]|eukprot:KNE72201.1 hypothetical protein AMAG_16685 [Allomyces macrogynus ATCC 38327]
MTASLCLVNLPQDVLNIVAELLNRSDRRALLHLAFAAPTLYAVCLHVAIRTDTDGGIPRKDYYDDFRFVGDSPDSANIMPTMLGTVQDTRRDPSASQPSWHLILLPRSADRSLVPLPGRITDTVVANWHWSLLPVLERQLRRCAAYPKRDWTTVDLPLHCTVLRLGFDLDFGKFTIAQSVVKLVLESVESVTLVPTGSALPHLREFGVSFDKSLFLDREKSVAAATTLFSLVPPSLTVLKLADLGEHALLVAARLVRQLPSLAELHMFANNHRTIKGFDSVMAALPRSGFPYLHLVLNTRDTVGWDEEKAMVDKLVASFPRSVHSLFITSNVWLLRAPLATHALTIDVDAMLHDESSKLAQNLLAPTLRRLTIVESDFDHDIAPVLEQLPASLVHLELRQVRLNRHGLAALARAFPPQLESLYLHGGELTAAVLDQYLTGAWPSTLSHLDLTFGFEFESSLPLIPSSVRVLTMDLVCALLSTDGDAMVAAWITALPPSVRVLNMYLNSTFRSALVDVLLTVTRVRVSGWRRMHEWNEPFDVPVAVTTALAAQFASFDVLHEIEDDLWRRKYGDLL